MLRYIRQTVVLIILMSFIGSSIQMPVYAQIDPMPFMPSPGVMVHLSPEYTPAYLKGIVIHPENALKFDFIIYKGDKPLTDSQKREEYTKLTKYFLASLAIPDDDQWVNLSPYEKDRIIKDDFGKTEMGRDLLAQDYLLKQITASLIYPEDNLGKKFWDRVYTQAQKQYGTTNIPVNTFNKVWILPDDALIYEKGNTAYVLKNHLRVMLEEDYLSLQKHFGITTKRQPGDMFKSELQRTCPQVGCQANDGLKVKAPQGNNPKTVPTTHSLASKIIKEIVLPELQREVNEDKNFAALRQVYSGMLLAAWYKRALKESLLSKIYANKAKVKGVDQDSKTNEKIYRQYLKAYKKGVFNFIKEDMDKYTNETILRKYFSGGTTGFDNKTYSQAVRTVTVLNFAQNAAMVAAIKGNDFDLATVGTEEQVVAMRDAAMLSRRTLGKIALGGGALVLTSTLRFNYYSMTLLEIAGRLGIRAQEMESFSDNGRNYLQIITVPGADFSNLTLHALREITGDNTLKLWAGNFNLETIKEGNENFKKRKREGWSEIDHLDNYFTYRFLIIESNGEIAQMKAFSAISELRANGDSAMMSKEKFNAMLSGKKENPLFEIALKLIFIIPLAVGLYWATSSLEEDTMSGYFESSSIIAEQKFLFKEGVGFKVRDLIHYDGIEGTVSEIRRHPSGLILLKFDNGKIILINPNPPLVDFKLIKQGSSNQTMNKEKTSDVGGIDFNSANLNLQIKRDGKGVPLPISQQNLESIHIDGLIPVIIEIKPAVDSPLLSELQVNSP